MIQKINMPKKSISKKAPKEIKENKTWAKVVVYDIEGKAAGRMELPREIFQMPANPKLMAQAVRVYLANQRLGTHSSKTRAEVAGSTRKIYRQKGTGRARHGDIKAPIFIGGGVAHGPRPIDYSLKLPEKMKRLALFGALTGKLTEEKIMVVKGLEDIEAKTRRMAEILKNLKLTSDKKKPKILLILPKPLSNVFLAGRNYEGLQLREANLLNTFEVLSHENLLFMQEAIPVLKGTFLKVSRADSEKVKPVENKTLPKKKVIKSKLKIKKIKKIK